MAKPHGIPYVSGLYSQKATNYRALLRKIMYKDKAYFVSSAPVTPNQYVYMCVRVRQKARGSKRVRV